MTRICVPIFVHSAEQARRDAIVAVERGADMIELRIDRLGDDALLDGESQALRESIIRLVNDLREQAVPAIFTYRPAAEGGHSEADDETRFTTLAHLVHAAPAWVDLEWRPMSRGGGWPMAFLDLAADGAAGGGTTRFIVSAHDFETRPSDLLSLFAEMSLSRGDVPKLAWRARSVRDNVEAFELLREAAKPTVAICMGEAGLPSRVLAKKFGAYLTFASLDVDHATADGQVPIDELKRRYRWDAIGRDTAVYGVIGHPIGHSRSPHVHNAAFDAVGHDGVYLPLLVQPGYESFKAFMETWLGFGPLDLAGLSVTLPHKENALRYVREVGGDVDAKAEAIGAANTITIRRDDDGTPKLLATNTDHDAILETICEARSCTKADLADVSVGVVGAGGTGRTAVAALVSVGATVTVYNRTRSRADALANEFDAVGAGLGDARAAEHAVWINTTSVGMSPEIEQDPLGTAFPNVTPATLVFDTIYNPAETQLLRRAREAGAATVNGEPMFLRQAAAQFEQWTGQPAPLDEMQAALSG